MWIIPWMWAGLWRCPGDQGQGGPEPLAQPFPPYIYCQEAHNALILQTPELALDLPLPFTAHLPGIRPEFICVNAQALPSGWDPTSRLAMVGTQHTSTILNAPSI